jgi:hypothetical protein
VITVDIKGRITSASNTTISGVSPAGSNLTTGKAWIGNGTGKAAEAYINVSDLKRSSDGAAQFPTNCNAGQTLTWSSVIDVFTCSSITITKSQISDFPTLGTAATKDFGSSSGNLVELDSGGKIPSSLLPSGAVSQWQDAGSDIYYDGGRVGVGTNAPAYLLDLRNANSVSQIHLSGTGNDDGGYFTAFQGTDLYINMGSAFDGSHWVAKNSNASIFSQQNGLFNFYSDTGLTPGSTYTPTERARLSYEGDLRLTGTMTAGEKTLAALPSLGAITAYSSDIWSGTSRGVNSVQISSNVDAAAFIGRKARGVLGAATTIQDGDYISMLAAGPYDGTDYLVPSMAAFVVNGTVATGSVPTDFVVHTGAMGDYGGTERFRITSTGKVGIGTADPSTDLEVAGTIKATAFEGPLTSTSTSLGDGSASSPSLTFSSDSNTGFYSSGADKIGVSAGGVKVWDITASGIVSPTAGGASISSAAGTAAAPTFSFAGDTDTGWFHPAVDTLAASTGGTERVRIDASGNVGIGTVNPQAPLQIGKGLTFYSGTSTAIGFNQYYDYVDSRWEAADSGYSSLMWLEKSTGIMRFGSSGAAASAPGDAASNWMSLALNPNGNVGIGTTNPGAKLHIQGSDGTVGLLVENVDSSSSRYPYATVTNYRGATDTSGYPVYHLINNRGAKGSQLPVQNGDWLGAIQFWGADSTASGSANRGAQIIGIARETFTTSSGATDLAFFTSPSGAADSTSYERLRITSAGNVGIGTTLPSTKLEVNGPIRSSSGATTSGIGKIILTDGGSAGSVATIQGNPAGEGLIFSGLSDGEANPDFVLLNGKVGIGTASPAYNLDLKGVLRVADTDTVGQIRIGDASGYSGDMAPTIWAEPIGSNRATWFLSQVSAGEDTGTAPAILMTARVGTSTNITSRSIFAIRNNTTDLMSVGATGNVGIGTTNPLAKLDVAGSIQFGSSSGSNKGYLSYYNVSPYNQAEVGSLGATTSLSLVTNNQSRLNITPAGNVGIGTVTPVTKLDVWGDVSVSGTTVHSSDRRLKEDIHPLENSLEKILQLNGYNYHWKNKQISPREQIGVIAQEVKEVFPDLVSTNPHTGFYSVNYEGLIPPLIEATKEIHHLCQMGENQAQSLSAQLARHERDIASLKEENAQQQQQIRELKEALCALSPKAEICRH